VNRFQLDEATAQHFEREVMRPAILAQCEPAFVEKLRAAWDGKERILDLSQRLDDTTFTVQLAQRLLQLGRAGAVYSPSFLELAGRMVKSFNPSIVDRLGSLYQQPPPQAIKGTVDDTRERALQKMKERRGLG